jgi:tetratricopeptide (TPR) repeat protein
VPRGNRNKVLSNDRQGKRINQRVGSFLFWLPAALILLSLLFNSGLQKNVFSNPTHFLTLDQAWDNSPLERIFGNTNDRGPLLAPVVYAATHEVHPSILFSAGNRHYAEGNFKAAIEQYEKLVNLPFSNEMVYYNLGNAYFKDNQLGKAILCFEKAIRLDPRDRDTQANLNLAKSRIADKIESKQENLISKQWKKMNSLLPLEMETLIVLLLFVSANLCFTLFLLSPSSSLSRLALIWAGVLFSFALVLGVSDAIRIYQMETLREGVVLVDKVDVVSGPSADNPVLFSVHEGLKIRIENEMEGWLQISLENGWNGWLRKETVGTI